MTTEDIERYQTRVAEAERVLAYFQSMPRTPANEACISYTKHKLAGLKARITRLRKLQ